ncbi:uncharacterized protein CANTADRAFT_6645 [Suhomyces tanzawaensis NRRL Y-17324]|uniref:Uncharacterized protein n=1 Tax=Suhomyces tanzawaensis NRRL Y-17324 TaxID=984487 RepID=A0A1E4SFH9_9ASCO|nr:uncharacterized protein CANTADRAFT_6645 [Suhomyces tanzawaensis NRRL Y-17324]ODV78236.1 hypothetical protein CANTADRAFT_6645 [Suhomyces tanzawaensis NRRL Y-17324]
MLLISKNTLQLSEYIQRVSQLLERDGYERVKVILTKDSADQLEIFGNEEPLSIRQICNLEKIDVFLLDEPSDIYRVVKQLYEVTFEIYNAESPTLLAFHNILSDLFGDTDKDNQSNIEWVQCKEAKGKVVNEILCLLYNLQSYSDTSVVWNESFRLPSGIERTFSIDIWNVNLSKPMHALNNNYGDIKLGDYISRWFKIGKI